MWYLLSIGLHTNCLKSHPFLPVPQQRRNKRRKRSGFPFLALEAEVDDEEEDEDEDDEEFGAGGKIYPSGNLPMFLIRPRVLKRDHIH